jgi:type II secretory pathway pseudopilin PulG
MDHFRPEGGETLIELLVTILVISIGLVAVVAAMGSSIIASDAHQSAASGEAVIRDYAEAVKAKASTMTTLCPTRDEMEPSFTPPAGWAVEIADPPEYWIKGAGFSDGTWGSHTDCTTQLAPPQCSAADLPTCDPGLRRLTLLASNDRSDYAQRTMSTRILVRRANP